MINDKITPQLRKRFLQEIEDTKKTQKERGFQICIEKDGKLSAGPTYVGNEWRIESSAKIPSCKGRKIQGDFHVHITPEDDPEGELMNSLGITHTSPSQGDVINALLEKCRDKTIRATKCVGSALDINRVECWTPKDNISDKDCKRVKTEGYDPTDFPYDWTRRLFHIEMIDLKSE